MPSPAALNPQPEPDRLEAAADHRPSQRAAATRATLCKPLLVANEFLETEVCELMQAVSHAYIRGRFRTYTG